MKIRRAGAVKLTPGLRFHIALCEERLGQLVAALDGYAAAQVAARAEDNHEVLDLVAEPIAIPAGPHADGHHQHPGPHLGW